MKNAKTLAGILAIAVVGISGASAGGLVIAEFELGDHPDGSAAVPYYGLRLDNILEAGTMTLSMEYHDNTRLTVIDNNGDLSMRITGTLFGGVVNNNSYVSTNSYEIDFTYALNVTDSGDGWVVNGFDAGNTGTITNMTTQEVTTLYGKANMAGLVFSMRADGHRMGDSSSWVGRGWLTTNEDGSSPAAGSQDWLFTANPIPSPSGLAILGLSGLMTARRRR